MQPPEVVSVGADVPLLMEEDSQDVNNLRDTYHKLKMQLHCLIAEVRGNSFAPCHEIKPVHLSLNKNVRLPRGLPPCPVFNIAVQGL